MTREERFRASFDEHHRAVPRVEVPVANRVASAQVMRALAQLKSVDRDLVRLVAWDELTPSQVGEVVGLRPVTARPRLHRARRRLEVLLERSPASPSPFMSAQGDRRAC